MTLFWISQIAIILITTINTGTSLENVALGKTADQSGSRFLFSTADKAVDGNTNPDLYQESCAFVDTSQLSGQDRNQPAFWKVDLGASYDVYQVVISNRDGARDLLSDTLVTVSDKEEVTTNNDNISNEIVNGVQDVIEITCNYKNRNPPLRGRYVTIKRKDDAFNRHWLNFCEVEVLSCPPGRWGYNSDNSREDCSHPDGNPCDQTDGLCPHVAAQSKPATDTEGVNIELVAGIVVVFIVLTTAGIIVTFFLYRRYRKQKLNKHPPPDLLREARNAVVELPSISENTTVYDDVQECGGLEQTDEKQCENSDNIHVPLESMGMETVRDHMNSTNDQGLQHLSCQNVTLPKLVYDYVYAGRQPISVALKDVSGYIRDVQEETDKFEEEYNEEAYALYNALIDRMETADTAVPCSKFIKFPQNINYTLLEQYQVLELLKPPQDMNQNSGLKPENAIKNRSEDIVPNDRFRPALRVYPGGGNDYINAVVVVGTNERENYILTQSPLQETVVDLWRLVNDYNSSTIVMLNQIPKDQEERNSAVVYWPPEVGASMEFGSMIISNNGYAVDSKNKNVHIRELELNIKDSDYESERMKVKQFSIKEWNQSRLIRDFMRLIELIEKWQCETSSQNGPIAIHCLDGAERSGLFCVALYVAQQIMTQQKVDIFSAVKHVRLYRPQCIRNEEQYMFLHDFANEYIKRRI